MAVRNLGDYEQGRKHKSKGSTYCDKMSEKKHGEKSREAMELEGTDGRRIHAYLYTDWVKRQCWLKR